MNDEIAETTREQWPGSFDLYLASHLTAYAIGAAVAVPVVGLLFFSGPLGEFRASAAPYVPYLGSWWVPILALSAALHGQFKPALAGSGTSAAVCFAGMAWVAFHFLSTIPREHPFISLSLCAVFGACWLAKVWPKATPPERRIAVYIALFSIAAAIVGPVLVTRLRLAGS